MKINMLTGIKPTGDLHLGNYIGCIKPILDILKKEKNQTILFFVADYHALTSHIKPTELSQNIKKLMGELSSIFYHNNYDPSNKVYLYRQSKIISTFELNWILSCYTAKGLLNRNHTYKHLTQQNINNNHDPDKKIFQGVFNYPVLMASDILLFQPDYVPIGPDQSQHITICNDIAQKINHVYKKKLFNYINPYIMSDTVLYGNNDKKMSKSYNNACSLFSNKEQILKYIFKYKTNSKLTGQQKSPEDSNITSLINNFGSDQAKIEYLNCLNNGTSWKDIKEFVYYVVLDNIYKFKSLLDTIYNDFETTKLHFLESEKILNELAFDNITKIKNTIGLEIM